MTITSTLYNAYVSVFMALLIPLSIIQNPVTVYQTVPGQVSIGVLLFVLFSWLMLKDKQSASQLARVSVSKEKEV